VAQPRIGTPSALFQISTLNSLANGDYDGKASCRELRRDRDFGLGTFDQLDGEMVALDGRFCQVRIDGVPRRVSNDQRTPFAAVTHFASDEAFAIEDPVTCTQLEDTLAERVYRD